MTKVDTRKTAVRVSSLIANCPDSHSEIAAKLGVDKSTVTRWRSGTRKPTQAQLDRLEELYGSLAAAESLDAEQSTVVAEAVANPPKAGPALRALLTDREEAVDEYPDEDNHARLRRYIRDGMRELQNEQGLSGVKRAEALKKLADAQVALDRSTGENALTMRRIVAHPEFLRVVKLITEAIAPFPEALRAATEALEVFR